MENKTTIAEFLSKGEKVRKGFYALCYITLHYWGTTQTKGTLTSHNNGTAFEHEKENFHYTFTLSKSNRPSNNRHY